MSGSIFQEGGNHKIRRTGPDEYTMSVSIPTDENGRVARQCPSQNCSPGYFKIKPGTGVTEEQTEAFCPYCRHCDESDEFATAEQLRYAEDIATQEAERGVDRMVRDAFGLGPSGRKRYDGGLISMEINYKSDTTPHVPHPFEEELRRDVVCPHCGLDHSVFGLAVWCPDCGRDIFMTHVKAEYDVVKKMLTDIDRRRKELGARVAARDVENCLEDTVSIFEAALKAIIRRYLKTKEIPDKEIERLLNKRIRNRLQNIRQAQETVKAELGIDLFEQQNAETIDKVSNTFAKRHPITHNLGIVDRKYIENARSAEREGRDIRVTVKEINDAMDFIIDTLSGLHLRLFQEDINR